MNILQVSLLKRPVNKDMTAARPKVIYDLCTGLVEKGHTVSLLGTKNSFIDGVKILPVVEQSFTEHEPFENPFYAHTAMLTTLAMELKKNASHYDIIHNHTYPEFINLLMSESINTPIVTTIHAQPFDEYDQALSYFNDTNHFISLSESHQSLFKKTAFMTHVYNGIDTNLYSFQKEKDDYLLWLGRLSKAKNAQGEFMDPKGVGWAIKLAQETGERLIISGNVEDMDFYTNLIKPHLNEKITWRGTVGPESPLTKEEVAYLMRNAKAYLMTVNWNEPFGLVMVESMASGTPVIGFDRGAVSEIVEDGRTGFVVNPSEGIEGLKKALSRLSEINPQDCRTLAEEKFSVSQMVNRYEEVYKKALDVKDSV